MSDIIRLLPDSVANQIAAGEVIQRPSSVIKEMVENAIDAGATDIQVVVVDAGKTCIQVIDNGKGMSETDARLAFERHATSKITAAADLFALRTMGFRGEALASIAAVAQVELRTRQKESDLGTSLVIEGSRVKSQAPIACAVGANFSVRNLFYNIPARRKFLKSNQTELANIMSEMERVALAHPDIAFTLYNDDHRLLHLPSGNFKERIVGLFGKRIDTGLLPVSVDTTMVKISGYIGTPQQAKKKGAHRFFFVNGRYMRHPYFDKAVLSAYERLIAEGTSPSYFIQFEIDPSHIDVNIHPQKTEIKFQDEQAIWPILLAAVREALGKSASLPTIDFDTENRPDIPMFRSDNNDVTPPTIAVDVNYNPFTKGNTSSASAASNYRPSKTHSSADEWKTLYEHALSTMDTSASAVNTPDVASPAFTDLPFAEEQEAHTVSIDEDSCFQFMGRFIIFATSAGLHLVDQHRAHMRILYENYLHQMQGRGGISQGMLFPGLLQLSPSGAVVMETFLDELQHIGFDLSPLGDGAYSVLGIPAGIEGLDPVDLLQILIAEASEGQIKMKEQVHKHIAGVLARKAALPVGQFLDKKEQVELLQQLYRCELPHYAPDGSVVVKQIEQDQVVRWFTTSSEL